MKKRIISLLLILLVFLNSCGKEEEKSKTLSSGLCLISPFYNNITFDATGATNVKESKEYAVIFTYNTFFVYDKLEKRITRAYGIDVSKTFNLDKETSMGDIGFEKDTNEVIITAIYDFKGFDDYYFVYNIKEDSFKRVEGPHINNSRGIDEPDYTTIEYEDGKGSTPYYMSLETVYFTSLESGEKIFPFRNGFDKKAFEIK